MPNDIVLENQKPGTPRSVWDAPESREIEGFATDMSVNHGATVSFKVNLDVAPGASAPYHIEIYRLGYYGGSGATLVTTLNGLTGIAQPDPVRDSRGDVDAGNWSVSASWSTPATAVSGVYLAKLVRDDDGATNQIPFIVRADDSHSDIVLQTSDTTWEAYNGWAGRNGQVGGSLYGGYTQPPGLEPDPAPLDYNRAFAVSYNRPFITRDGGGEYAGGQDYLFGSDYAAIYWLEKNGYDVSYISGVDTDRLGLGELLNHKAFLSVGHDEYWSGDQRANVEAARDAGVNLLFWSGNEVFWKTRWENSIADGGDHRTLVSYKETKANYSLTAGPQDYANTDPSNQWTGTWRDTRFVNAVGPDGVTHTAVGARPENSLSGQLFIADGSGQFGGAINVPAGLAGLRIWRNTGVGPGGATGIAPGIIGYEWDTAPNDANAPPGLIRVSDTTISWSEILTDQGNRTSPGTAEHSITIYRAASGALVFGAGTVFWSWGLDNQHDQSPYAANIANTAVQQLSLNVLADMGIQPGVADAILASEGLVRASASSDLAPAVATFTNPPPSVAAQAPVTLAGSASDSGGKVALVEVSVDGGHSWHAATGTTSWSYTWTPAAAGSATVEARAWDDSLNTPGAGQVATQLITVTAPVNSGSGSFFGSGPAPTGSLYNDHAQVELGMRFVPSAAGQVVSLNYYRAAGDADDTDTRQGHLWSSNGTLLGSVTFVSGPGQAGWQTANLTTPVTLTPGATYIVSYTTSDNYEATGGYFSTAVTAPSGLLTAPSGANGVYAYGGGLNFPASSYNSTNYWVDVGFQTQVNHPPAFTGAATLSVAENAADVGVIGAADPDGDVLAYTISGGADAQLFSINAKTGDLRFLAAPDYEAPKDAGANNIYDLVVNVSDGKGGSAQQAIQVKVTDVTDTHTGPGVFTGHAVTAQYIFGATPTTLYPAANASQTASVGSAVEFTGLPPADPASLGNGADPLVTVDVAASTVRIEYPLDPTVFPGAWTPFASVANAPYNGVRLFSTDGSVGNIRAVSIQSQGGFTDASGNPAPLTNADLSFDATGVFLNVAGKGRLTDIDATAPGQQAAFVVLQVQIDSAPVAVAETYGTSANTPLLLSTADLLTGVTDADGDRLTVTAVGDAANGAVTLDAASGVVTFTPTAGFNGAASFDYVVVDGFGGSAKGVVTVNVTASGGGGSGGQALVAAPTASMAADTAAGAPPETVATQNLVAAGDATKLQPAAGEAPAAPALLPMIDSSSDLGGPSFRFGPTDPGLAGADSAESFGPESTGVLGSAGPVDASVQLLLDALSQPISSPDPAEAGLTTQELIAGLKGAAALSMTDAFF